MNIPHALLHGPDCPHQPSVQFLGAHQATTQPLCGAQRHRERDSGDKLHTRGQLQRRAGMPYPCPAVGPLPPRPVPGLRKQLLECGPWLAV